MSSRAFDRVEIGSIENNTIGLGLEDMLAQSLSDEFLSNGVKVGKGSGYVISGVINKYELRSLAQRADITFRFEVYVEGEFFLKSPNGLSKKLAGGGMFPVVFTSEGSLDNLVALKQRAEQRAIKDLASALVVSALYE